MIIDEFLPTYDVAEEHRVVVHADPDVVYSNVRHLDMSRSWSIPQLFRVRGLPHDALTIEGLQRMRFALLADVPAREMVLGLIGRFWTISGQLRHTDAADFRTFIEPGYAKAAWNFFLKEQPDGSVILSTETRVLCLDEHSRRSFRRYWRIISPFSGWIRNQMLRIVKDGSERKP
jgi:hypothetical protein